MLEQSESTCRFSRVQREHVVAAALVRPEALVERALELGGVLLEPVGERAIAPDLARELGRAELRVVDVALDLARRDRRLRQRPVVKALGVARVLPRLVREPARRPALVLDEPVAVAVAVLVDPPERAQRGLLELAHQRRVVGPAPDLGEQDEVERGRVDGPVVGAEPVLGGLAGPKLVDDLARLRVDVGVVLSRLELGEHLERRPRELGPEQQRLQTGDERVAPEDGHEPRHPRGRQPPHPAAAAHPERREVRDRLQEAAREVVPVAADLRDAKLPGGERLAHARHLLAEAPLGRAWRDRVAVDRGHDVEPELPGLPRARARGRRRPSTRLSGRAARGSPASSQRLPRPARGARTGSRPRRRRPRPAPGAARRGLSRRARSRAP